MRRAGLSSVRVRICVLFRLLFLGKDRCASLVEWYAAAEQNKHFLLLFVSAPFASARGASHLVGLVVHVCNGITGDMLFSSLKFTLPPLEHWEPALRINSSAP